MKTKLTALIFSGMLVAILAIPSVVIAQEQGGAAKGRDAEREAAIERAKTFLAARPGLARKLIKLETATAATWTDASLGCPEKDKVYAQMLSEGFRVVLQADSTSYEVHVADKRVVLCPAAPPTKR
jgi:hypothetical protein